MMDCVRLSDNFVTDLNVWASRNKIPLTMTFELTPFCNFNCVMCYVRLNQEQADAQGSLRTVDEWLEIAEQAKNSGTLNLTLTGGEPLLYPGFWELYEKLNSMGFLLSIMSNGSQIDEDAIMKFRKYGHPFFMAITLYGANDETYQKVCGVSDGFSRVSKAIDLLKEEGIPVKLTSTIVHENADDLRAIHNLAKKKGLSLNHTVSVVKSSRGTTNTAATSRFEFADFSDELTLDYLERSRFPWNEDPFAICASKNNSLFVTWHGHLQLCAFLCKPFVEYSGDLNDDFLLLNKKLHKIKNPSECVTCKWKDFCQRCPAILCAESGDPEKVDKSFCRMAERLYEIYIMKKGI